MKRYRDYDGFAWLYNQAWGAYGANILPALKKIAGGKLAAGANILDLCCGTGQLAKALVENGYEVTGVDGSAEMIRYARQNAPGANFLVKDARSFKMLPEFDAVFSTFDALNHVLTMEELQKVFVNVYSCLKKGGVFIFDMTTQKHFEVHAANYQETKATAEYLYFMRTEYDREKKIYQWDCTIFRPAGQLWRRTDVRLYQTWYPLETLKAALGGAGFRNIRAHSFNQQREMETATEEHDRFFFYGQRTK